LLTQLLPHGGRIHTAVFFQQFHQHRLDSRLALACRQVQNPQIFFVRPRRLTLAQHVVGHAEVAAGKQILTVAIVGERPGLADQPVDDVPIVDAMLATSAQAWQPLHQLLGVPHFDALGKQAGLHPFADQSAGHRVDVVLHLDDAARFHTHTQPLARLQALTRQRPQQRHFLCQPRGPTDVFLPALLAQERQVAVPAGEVSAAPHHQRLVHTPLELVVALFRVAVLVALAGLDGLAMQAVVTQQRLITLLERLRSFDARLHGRRQPIRAMHLRHAAQFPQRVLQPVAEALQAFREAERDRLPIGVREHEMIEQVRKRTAVDRHAQVAAVREVAGSEPTWMMDLGEEDLFGCAVQSPPGLEPPLQGAQLAVGETARETTLQVGEQGLGLQSGIEAEHLIEVRPDVGEGVGPGAIVAVHASDLAGQLAKPPVLAGGLGIDAGLVGGLFLGAGLQVEVAQAAHLLIGDHPKPPCEEGLRIR
jgi:hypothetical protein